VNATAIMTANIFFIRFPSRGSIWILEGNPFNNDANGFPTRK
jgi:hypothetical protein